MRAPRVEGGGADRFFALVADAAARVVAPPYRAEDIEVYIRESFGLSDKERVSVVPVAGGESSTWSVLESFMWREEQGGLNAARAGAVAAGCPPVLAPPVRQFPQSRVERSGWLGDWSLASMFNERSLVFGGRSFFIHCYVGHDDELVRKFFIFVG